MMPKKAARFNQKKLLIQFLKVKIKLRPKSQPRRTKTMPQQKHLQRAKVKPQTTLLQLAKTKPPPNQFEPTMNQPQKLQTEQHRRSLLYQQPIPRIWTQMSCQISHSGVLTKSTPTASQLISSSTVNTVPRKFLLLKTTSCVTTKLNPRHGTV